MSDADGDGGMVAGQDTPAEPALLSGFPKTGRPRRRVGRGPGSGRGKTCGRGMKGQKARAGVALGEFEGGQTPLHRRLPKRGFRNTMFRVRPASVNLDRLQQAVDAGRLDPEVPVDDAVLLATGIVRRAPDGVRILGRGQLKAKLQIRVAGASKTAVAAITAAGGSFEKIERKRGGGEDSA